VSVQHVPEYDFWRWSCIFGCQSEQKSWDFKTEAEAVQSFLTHRCLA
jgi:hypothetical protein